MKGYKITTNGKCLNLRYEVGKIYTLNGKLEICKTGFHFCLNADDLFDYYCYKKGITKIFEIEAIGEIIDSNDKSVTNKIKIIREIPFEEYNELFDKYKFDEIGQLITKKYMKYGKLVIFNYIYDNNGNLIKEENNKSSWTKYKYDEKGNVIKIENFNGYWEEYMYDENGSMINYNNWYGNNYSIIIE